MHCLLVEDVSSNFCLLETGAASTQKRNIWQILKNKEEADKEVQWKMHTILPNQICQMIAFAKREHEDPFYK